MGVLQKKFRMAPVTVCLTAAMVAVYFLAPLFGPHALWRLGLSRNALAAGEWWTVVTHLFLHANLLHLAVNALSLWFVGPTVEITLGRRKFVILYFISGITGGLLQTFFFGQPGTELIGASGAVCGVLLAFTTSFPEARLQALLFFIVPVRMRAKTLGWGIIAFSAFCAALNIMPIIGHLAHLGGALAGWALTKLWKVGTVGGFPLPEAPIPLDEILRRVQEQGIEGLSPEQKRRLELLEKNKDAYRRR